jgi:hypothetical protein
MPPIIWSSGNVRVRLTGPHPKFGPSGRLVTCTLSLPRLKPARFVCGWHLVAQGRVGSLRIVLHSPGFNGGARFREGAKPVLVQALLPKPGVEGLDKWIIRRRPWPAESQLDAMAMRPGFSALDVNSGPLSTHSVFGNPCVEASISSTATTRWPLRELSTSIAALSRLM